MITDPVSQTHYNGTGKQHTMSPTCTGASALGIKYKDGVILAADTLISYGSLARYMGYDRVCKINNNTVLASSGDIADFQLVKKRIEEQTHEETLLADGFNLRRSSFNPLWNSYIVGGLEPNGVPYLGFCNMIAFPENIVATGYGSFLAVPYLRDVFEKKANEDYAQFEEADAIKAITDSMRILHYRDARAFDQYSMAIVRRDGVEIRPSLKLDTNWDLADYVCGYE